MKFTWWGRFVLIVLLFTFMLFGRLHLQWADPQPNILSMNIGVEFSIHKDMLSWPESHVLETLKSRFAQAFTHRFSEPGPSKTSLNPIRGLDIASSENNQITVHSLLSGFQEMIRLEANSSEPDPSATI
ncbi:MAG: hypothetical protein KTR14_11115 [Vampirovibrio sp.]|nr:hypothetical protein [Vampirovibrio sp.]